MCHKNVTESQARCMLNGKWKSGWNGSFTLRGVSFHVILISLFIKLRLAPLLAHRLQHFEHHIYILNYENFNKIPRRGRTGPSTVFITQPSARSASTKDQVPKITPVSKGAKKEKRPGERSRPLRAGQAAHYKSPRCDAAVTRK